MSVHMVPITPTTPTTPIPRRRRAAGVLAALGLAVALALVAGPVPAATAPSAGPAAAAAARPSAAPAGCAHDGTYVWADLAACGWPAPSTTGVRLANCPHGLTAVGPGTTGEVDYATAGTVVSCAAISGCVRVSAPGVLFRDVVVQCTSGRQGEDANGTGVVTVDVGRSATLQHVTLNGLDGTHACVWHMGTSLKLRAVDCSGVDDGVFSWTAGPGAGDRADVRNSYFHDFTVKTANGHVDGYQTEGASHGRLIHNTWLMTTDAAGGGNDANSAIAIWDSLADSSDFVVSRNLIAGGGFAVYAEDYSPSEAAPGGGYSVTGIRFADNVFSTHLFDCVGYYGVWYPRSAPTDGWTRTGNTVLETGADIDAGNPTAHGQPCT